MMTSTISAVWTLPELDVEVISLVQPEYGSAAATALESLGANLQMRLEQSDAGRIVLDVKSVRYAGAAWLGGLANFANACRKAGRQLLFCGDTLGLLKWARLEGDTRVFPDAAAAIASLPRPEFVWPSRFSLPLALLNPAPRNDRIACSAD